MHKEDLVVYAVIGALAVAGSGIAYAVLQYYYSISNHGNIIAIGLVVVDVNDIPINGIDWGFLESGSQTDQVVYIKNNGTNAIIVNFETLNWNPLHAQDYLTLSWNYTNTILNPNDKIPTTLTLSVSSDANGIVTEFSFIVKMTATGA